MDWGSSIFKCLHSAEEYQQLPPSGPSDELPSANEEELKALQTTSFGQELDLNNYAYYSLTLIEDDVNPKEVLLPTTDALDGIEIFSIDGSNQRIDHPSFHVILSRAALVSFHYAKVPQKPLVSCSVRDLSGIVLVDGNIFRNDISVHTSTTKINSEDDGTQLLNCIWNNDTGPILWRHNPSSATNKLPAAQALGIAVKGQQSLELAMLQDIPVDGLGVCVRDGPLFSTSVGPRATYTGLQKVFAWREKVLIAVSKRVSDSTFLLELLLQKPEFLDYWFPKQTISDSTLKSMGSDSLLLSRIVKPGYRTPLVEAIGRARKTVVEQNGGLAPLACYYLSRTPPHTFIRLEIPRFMWERDQELAEKAISIVAWQHELGRRAPLVQLHADERCQLETEILAIRNQLKAEFYRKGHSFLEEYA